MKVTDKARRQLLEEIRVLRSTNVKLQRQNRQIPDFTDEPQIPNTGKVITDRLIFIGIGLGVLF